MVQPDVNQQYAMWATTMICYGPNAFDGSNGFIMLQGSFGKAHLKIPAEVAAEDLSTVWGVRGVLHGKAHRKGVLSCEEATYGSPRRRGRGPRSGGKHGAIDGGQKG
jgi:hypothetical protein